MSRFSSKGRHLRRCECGSTYSTVPGFPNGADIFRKTKEMKGMTKKKKTKNYADSSPLSNSGSSTQNPPPRETSLPTSKIHHRAPSSRLIRKREHIIQGALRVQTSFPSRQLFFGFMAIYTCIGRHTHLNQIHKNSRKQSNTSSGYIQFALSRDTTLSIAKVLYPRGTTSTLKISQDQTKQSHKKKPTTTILPSSP